MDFVRLTVIYQHNNLTAVLGGNTEAMHRRLDRLNLFYTQAKAIAQRGVKCMRVGVIPRVAVQLDGVCAEYDAPLAKLELSDHWNAVLALDQRTCSCKAHHDSRRGHVCRPARCLAHHWQCTFLLVDIRVAFRDKLYAAKILEPLRLCPLP